MVAAIIVAAGQSRRMGFDKVFTPLAGRPLIAHAIEAFERCRPIDEILIVTREERLEEMREFVTGQGFRKVVQLIPGGVERHLSVWHGLQAVREPETRYVAIHDGARPLTTPRMITACLKLARQTGAACLATPIPDTLKRASADGHVLEHIERADIWAMQTPQIFSTAVILQAYAQIVAAGEVVTDEVSAVQKLGVKISLLRNDDWNFKITVPRDLELAEHVLALRAAKK